MFLYDAQLAAAVQAPPASIDGVLLLQKTIDNLCDPADGLKWFNWIYMQVTQAVEDKAILAEFQDAAWLTELDVQFAALYFNALHGALTGGPCPGCWNALFSVRSQASVARIQFALAGMNAHINHDLPVAIVTTCRLTNTVPQHGTAQYRDYTALDPTMDALVDNAKQTLNVRLPGDALPPVSHLEDLFASWNLAAFRENAWNTAQSLWPDSPLEASVRMRAINFLTQAIGNGLLVPVP